MKLEQLLQPLYNLIEKEDKDSNIENDTLDQTPKPSKEDKLWTTAKAAIRLGVTQSRVRQLVMDGKLKSESPDKGQRDHLFEPKEIEDYIKRKKNKKKKKSQ